MPSHAHLISSRLAARTGTRQVEVVIQSDRAALAVDKAVAALWRELLAILRDDRGPAENFKRALAVLRRIQPTVRRDIEARLRKLAAWGHKSSARLLARTLPVAYLRAAAPVPAEAVEERDHAAVGDFREGRALVRTIATRDLSRDPTPRHVRSVAATGGSQLTEAEEPAEPAPSEDELRKLYQELIFPPPDRATIDRIIFAPSGNRTWQDRVASLTRLAQPEQLASILAAGMAQGKSQREIANDLLPAVNGVRSSARRIARTESLRVAHSLQQQAHEQLGDLVEAYVVHAQLDQWTRPWHAARNGTVYYKEPKAGQKGPFQMPNPPEEAADPSERPPNTPFVAPNCRCWLSPMLVPPPEIKDDPAKLAVFETNKDKVIPDPAVYSDWWQTAGEKQKKIAVGVKRYAAVKDQVGEDVRWEHFLDADTGDLVPLARLKAESDVARTERVAKARALIAERAALIRQTATFGFLPS